MLINNKHYQTMVKFLLIVLVFFLQPNSLSATQKFSVLDGSLSSQSINNSLYIFRDPTTKLTLDDVLQDTVALGFKKFTGTVPSFGYINDAVWYRFTIANDTEASLARILKIGVSWLDSISLYVVEPSGDFKGFQQGEFLQYANTSPLRHNLPYFEINLDPGKTTVFMRIFSKDAIITPLTLWKPSAFFYQDRWYNIYYGVIYGSIVVMILYNAFIFIFLRIPAYFFYVCYLTAFLLLNLTYNGFTYEFAQLNHLKWTDWLQSFSVYIFQMTGVLFAISYLSTKTSNPRLHLLLVVFFIVLSFSCTVIPFLSTYSVHMLSAVGFVSLYGFILLTIGIISWRRGNPLARFFVLALFFGLLGASITALVVLSFIPFTFFSYHAAEMGLLMEMILFSMALAYRYKYLRDEKEMVEQRYLETLTLTKNTLKNEVAKQTAALRLEKERAEKTARTDELTQMNNRRAFYQLSNNALNLARRHNHPLSVVILDLDHFKKLNDNYGHRAGDNVLKAFADTIHHHIRKTDIAGRIGGEEFALLLPYTDINVAINLAEKLRVIVGKTTVVHEQKEIHITTSIGVCQLQAQDKDLDELIARADQAMYKAKKSGRNRVIPNALDIQDSSG